MSTAPDAVAQAWQYHQAGQIQEAERRYRQILQSAPSQGNVWYLLGIACQMQGKLDEAIHSYLQAVQFNPRIAEAYTNLGVAYEAKDRADDAIHCYREALRINPAFAAPCNNLGLALIGQGNLEEAVVSFERALDLEPNFPEAHNNLGKARQEQGKLDDAAACYRRALELRPGYVDALNNLGVTLSHQGKVDEAEASFRRALTLDPSRADTQYNLANLFRVQRRLADAIACYREVLRLRPDHAEAYNGVGQALAGQWRLDEAIRSLREAIRIKPSFAEAYCNLAKALHEQFDLEEAAACYRRAAELQPDFGEAYGGLSAVLTVLGQPAEAERWWREQLRVQPGHAEAHCNLGVARARIGNFTGAEECLREALKHAPEYPRAAAELAMLLGRKLPESDVAALERLVTNPGFSDDDRGFLHFGLAHVYDASGRYAEATQHAHEANALDRRARRSRGQMYEPAAHTQLINDMMETFNPAFFARTRGWGSDSDRPVFVFGLPRSGTTLVEQILASHSQVHGAGEVGLSGEARDLLPDRQIGAAGAFTSPGWADRADVQRMAADYVRRLEALNRTTVRTVDKMPDNYLYLGALAALFPRARFIHCRRDLRDVALSCWLTGFAQVSWANDPECIATRFEDYQRLMRHWRRVLQVNMLEMSYEALVANVEGEARRLVTGTGLEWEPTCLDFHKTRRPVATASATQVRQPIYARSVGRWRHYSDALGPLFSRLGPGESM